MFETEIQNDKHIDSVQSDQVCEKVHIPLSLKSKTVTESVTGLVALHVSCSMRVHIALKTTTSQGD